MNRFEQFAKGGGLFDGRYKLLRPLSTEGGSADVWLALDANTVNDKERLLKEEPLTKEDLDVLQGLMVAIKVYRPKNALDIEGEQQFRDEFKIVYNCHHANLIHPTHFSIFQETPYLVLPYCKKGSSEMLIGKLTDNDDLWKFIGDVSSGLAYLHACYPPIIHQDVKPANVLIDDNHNYAITDFGISANFGSRHQYYYDDEHTGTLAYMAPERFMDDPVPMEESDIWALGATIYEIITGHVPYGEEGGQNQHKGKVTLTFPSGVGADIQRLISINLENEFSNCDITLKSLIYFSSEKIKKLPAKAVEIIKRFSDSEISGFYTSDISTEMLGDQINRMDLPLQASLHVLTSLFGVAVSENRTDRNPAKELLTLYENENNTALSEVRSAMGKKFLFKDEMKKFLSIQHKQNRAISLASEIELATGLEPNIICALVWADYKTYEYAGYRFSALIVRRQLNNYGTVFLNFNSRSSYRIVPLPGALSDVIDKERARQLVELAKGDEYYLASCSIIQGSDSIINGQTAVLAPASLYKANRKAIKKMKIDEDLVSVPDDSGGSIETNLAYYKGNIFRSNFRHWALGRTGILTKEEYAYLSGNKGPNTFSSNYCDYGNLISLTKLYLKIERVWKEMNNE